MTLQGDAFQSGLEVALLQGGQPVTYVSRDLTPMETRYAQGTSCIVFACELTSPSPSYFPLDLHYLHIHACISHFFSLFLSLKFYV